MSQFVHAVTFRIRYAETDQMGALNSPRALEWFEFGRTEWLRAAGMPYGDLERKGVFLPAIEAHCTYLQRATFDDPIELRIWLSQVGKASLRFEYIAAFKGGESDGQVLTGWTTHAFVDKSGRAIRPPQELMSRLKTLVHSGSPGE